MLLLGFARSRFRHFENYFRVVVSLDKDDIQFFLKQYKSKFVTFDLSPGNYRIKDNSKLFTPRVILMETCKLNLMI